MGRVRVTFRPGVQTALVPSGTTILQAAILAGLAIEAPCAGSGTCGRCCIKASGNLYPPSAEEARLLNKQALAKGIRLACLARIASEASIELLTLPSEKMGGRKAGLSPGMGMALAPCIRKIPLPASELNTGTSQSILESLRSSLTRRGYPLGTCELSLLRELARVGASDSVTVVLAGERLIALESGDTTTDNYGIAIDLGTSTVVGYLLDLNTGHQLAAWGTANPQRAHGEDVVSRIQYSIEVSLDLLQSEAIQVINDVVKEVTAESGVKTTSIYEGALVGNTCMLHLVMGISPASLAFAPYRAVTTEPVEVPAREMGIEINPNGRLYVLPSIAGFVGSDTVGVILATGMHRSRELKLAIDLGTNGELVLGSRERLLCCSTAAGPAFEGGRIQHGMSASPGAIERVIWDHEPKVVVVGDVTPKGICGSGLVDAVAGMLRRGIIDESGRLTRSGQENRFILVDSSESDDGEPICVTQRDIRELQLAKAAIRAGIEILKEELGVADGDISEVLLAGAFGSYVDKESAAAIGLLPPVSLDRVRSVGNAAGTGAKHALLSVRARKQAEQLAKRVEYIELSTRSDFQDRFVAAMPFPPRG